MAYWLFMALVVVGPILLLIALCFAYGHHPFSGAWDCASLPPNCVVLALGFEYGQNPDGMAGEGDRLDPGEANRFLAAEVLRCQERIGSVFTQKAISDVLEEEGSLTSGRLPGGAPVLQMHAHLPGQPVRTLRALQQALDQMQPLPAGLVLLAHDKQVERARQDLASLYKGQIDIWQVENVPYQDEKWFRPMLWALRELYLARPVEAFQRWQIRLK